MDFFEKNIPGTRKHRELSIKIFLTLKSFPRLKILEVAETVKLLAVCPAGEVFLPLRYRMPRVSRVSVGLGVRDDPPVPFPVVDALEALLEVHKL